MLFLIDMRRWNGPSPGDELEDDEAFRAASRRRAWRMIATSVMTITLAMLWSATTNVPPVLLALAVVSLLAGVGLGLALQLLRMIRDP